MTADLRITFGERVAHARLDETVLDALLRVGAPMPFSCRSGVCRTCLMRCVGGSVPARAQRGLPEHLVREHYLLPCQCRPETSMVLAARRPDDLLTTCLVASTAGHGGDELVVELEPMNDIAYQTGDRLRLVDGSAHEPTLTLVSTPGQDYLLRASLRLEPGHAVPEALRADADFGAEVVLRGPWPAAEAKATVTATPQQLPPEAMAPEPDAALWAELDDGRTVRQVLEAFYAKVYADAALAPFFEGVTKDRAIEKQYAFLKQCITGEKSYFGNRPRNAHHWMIISDALFDHRQSLMVQTLREHGLDDDRIARWTSFEEHFRADIVKAAAWPRQVGDQWIDTETFDVETLGEASVCDYCGCEIAAGTQVHFHRRLGRIGCAACTHAPGVSA